MPIIRSNSLYHENSKQQPLRLYMAAAVPAYSFAEITALRL